jgi:hypothetical protein
MTEQKRDFEQELLESIEDIRAYKHGEKELRTRTLVYFAPRQRPSETLKIFHVDHFPEHLTLRREDEYGDDGR